MPKVTLLDVGGSRLRVTEAGTYNGHDYWDVRLLSGSWPNRGELAGLVCGTIRSYECSIRTTGGKDLVISAPHPQPKSKKP